MGEEPGNVVADAPYVNINDYIDLGNAAIAVGLVPAGSRYYDPATAASLGVLLDAAITAAVSLPSIPEQQAAYQEIYDVASRAGLNAVAGRAASKL